MKWLKSTTQKSWTMTCKNRQVIVPPCENKENKWLTLDEVEFAEVSALPVVASLIKAGSITVLDKEPAEVKNSLPNLQIANTTLRAELETVKAEKAALEARIRELEVGATGVDLEAEIAKATEALKAEYEQKLKELDDKATQMIADKDAEIADLKKALKKAKREEE